MIDMFETAIFTDVTAEESRDGRTGFTFQAVSPGFTEEQEAFARENLIHQVSPAIADSDPARDQSFTYCPNGGTAYFSRGASLGRTASGRNGNQITQIATASTPADIAPFTPAQIFAAKRWNLAKAEGGRAESWTTPLSVEPTFTSDALLAWVTTDPRRLDLLTALISSIDEILRHQTQDTIVLVHDELTEVFRWLSAASILSNEAAVRSIPFRAFVDDPRRGGFSVVGCRPSHALSPQPGMRIFNLIDITTSTEGPFTFGATRTRTLLNEQPDRALATIRLARAWDPYLAGDNAFWASELVNGLLPDEHVSHNADRTITVIDGLAQGGRVTDVEHHIVDFAAALRRANIDSPDQLHALARSARQAYEAGSPSLTRTLLDAILDVEAPEGAGDSRSQHLAVWAPELVASARGPWPLTQLSDEQYWMQRLLALRPADPADHRFVFSLASRLNPTATTSETDWDLAVQEFTAACFRDMSLISTIEGIWIAPRIRETLRRHLLRRLSGIGDSPKTLFARNPDIELLQQAEAAALVDSRFADDGRCFAPLHLIDEAVALGTIQSTKERAKAIRSSRAEWPPTQWALALAGTHPREDTDLWATWIERSDVSDGLVRYLTREMERDLESPPSKSLKGWREIADALIRFDREHVAFWRKMADDLEAHRRSEPSVVGQTRTRLTGLRSGRSEGERRGGQHS